MRLLRAATILALLLSPLYAGYVVKWTWSNGGIGYTLGKPTIFDVDGDSIPDILFSDSTSVTIHGVHGLNWTFPFARPGMSATLPVVTNTDDDSHNELVVSTPTVKGPGWSYPGRFGIYDCATHTLEFTSPGYQSVFAVADVDGDGRAEILAIDTNFVLSAWGWSSGSVSENPPSPPPTGIAKASPTPARRSVNFTLPASAGPGSVTITDVAGRIVRTLSAPARPGPRKVQWDCLDNSGGPVPAGTYVYRQGKTKGKVEVVR